MESDPGQVYPPAEDTELLCQAALRETGAGDRVLEIGTGSGAIAAALQEQVRCIVATDINPHAVAVARDRGIDVIRADLMAGIKGQFDLILFNPPYLPTRPEERIADWLEYALDGGENGRAVIERFLAEAGCLLGRRGRILLLISSLTGLPDILVMARAHGYYGEVACQQAVEDEVLYVLLLKRSR